MVKIKDVCSAFCTTWVMFSLWIWSDLAEAIDLPRIIPLADDKRIIFASVGEKISLRCPVRPKEDSTIYIEWSKGGSSLYLEEGYSDTERRVLRIKNVTADDSGLYTCSVINGHGSVSVTFVLKVTTPYEKPSHVFKNYSSMNTDLQLGNHERPSIIKENDFMRPLREDIGGNMELRCIAKGYPVPQIFWLKDGELLSGKYNSTNKSRTRTQSILTLRKLEASHSGNYRCLAKNEFGEDHVDFTLEVTAPLFPPEIESLTLSSPEIIKGHTVLLRCKGRNMPYLKLHIKWLKSIPENNLDAYRNRTFRLGPNFYRVVDTDEDPIIARNGIFQSELFISNSTFQDSGTYVCLAVNDKGFTYKNISLKVVQASAVWPTTYLLSEKPSVLVLVVLSAAVVLAPVIFIISLRCKCPTIKKIQSVQSQLKEECLPKSNKRKSSPNPASENLYYNGHKCEPYPKAQTSKLLPTYTAYEQPEDHS